MSARFAFALILAVAGGWVGAAPSAALEPGVFVEPGSPAGKEYTIPLSALRGAASGHAALGDQPQPLFGIGITPARGASAARGAGTERSGSAGRGASSQSAARVGGARPAAGAPSTHASRVPDAVLAAVSDHGSAAPALALFSAAVVLGGLGLGALMVAARRRLE